MLVETFKSNLNSYGQIGEYIESSLVKELKKRNLEGISKEQLSQVARKISYFMNLDKTVDIKIITLQREIIANKTYDYEPHEVELFLDYYHMIKKDDLLILNKENVLGLNKASIFISHYDKSDEISEYFYFIIHQFNKNLEAMKLHLVTEKPAFLCGFYGYIHLVDTLLNDINFYKR